MCFYRYVFTCISLLSLININLSHACETNFIKEIDSNYVDIKFIPVEDKNYIVYRVGVTDDGLSRRYFRDPEFVILEKRTCDTVKFITLNPQNDIVNAENSQHEIMLNENSNIIIVSQHWYLLKDNKTHNTISRYNYLTLEKEIEKRLDAGLSWKRSRKDFINDGKEIIFQNKKKDNSIILKKLRVEDLSLQSEYIIDANLITELGIQSKSGFDVVTFSRQEFEKQNLEWFYPEEAVTLLRLFGIDKTGNPKAIYYSMDNQPQAVLWYENNKLFHRAAKDYESRYNVIITSLPEKEQK